MNLLENDPIKYTLDERFKNVNNTTLKFPDGNFMFEPDKKSRVKNDVASSREITRVKNCCKHFFFIKAIILDAEYRSYVLVCRKCIVYVNVLGSF